MVCVDDYLYLLYILVIYGCVSSSGVIFFLVLVLFGWICIFKYCGYIKLYVIGWSLMCVEIILLWYIN